MVNEGGSKFMGCSSLCLGLVLTAVTILFPLNGKMGVYDTGKSRVLLQDLDDPEFAAHCARLLACPLECFQHCVLAEGAFKCCCR